MMIEVPPVGGAARMMTVTGSRTIVETGNS